MTTADKIYPLFHNHFKRIRQLGQGSFGKVYLCEKIKPNQAMTIQSNHQNQNNINQVNIVKDKTGEKESQNVYFALKKLKPYMRKKNGSSTIPSIENYPEVYFLQTLSHVNIISLREIVQNDKGYEKNHYLVMNFGIQLMDLTSHKQINLSNQQIKCLIRQLAQGIQYLHNRGIMHRDIKPSNIYLMEDGTLKLGDFSIMANTHSQAPSEMLQEQQEEIVLKRTANVTTRQFRAPEIIYGSRDYTQSIDIWSLGCTIAELLIGQTIFPGTTDIHQLELIFSIIGYPQDLWPEAQSLPYYLEFDNSKKALGLSNLIANAPTDLVSLVERMLNINPLKRPNISQILQDKYFIEESTNSQQQLGKVCAYLHQKKLRQKSPSH